MNDKISGHEEIDKKLEIEAADEKEALEKAYKHWKPQIDIEPEMISVSLVEKRSGFLGIKDKDNKYEAKLNIEDIDEIEEELEYLDEEIAIDGDFEIKFTEEGVMLKIIPPSGGGDPVRYIQIKHKVSEMDIEDVNWEAVQSAIDEPEEEWVKMAPRKPELDEDARVEVNICDDKLKATVDYEPARGGEEITAADLEEILNEAGVIYGVDNQALEEIVNSDEPIENFVVAEGKPPEPGEDAELNYHFEIDRENIGTEREDGSIDFFDRDLITNVEPGEVLVTKTPPVPGNSGKAVTGKELKPEEPKDKKLPAGKNVEKKENKLVAEIEGQVVKDGDKISVTPVHKVNGDVDLDVGNIDFVGSVVVNGDVQEGFSIKAEEDIEINGKVFAAQLEAGGNIKINKGFIGKEKGNVIAEGDVEIKFIENGNVESKGTVQVDDAIMHSTVTAAEEIILGKGKGLIVGGRCRAAKRIEASVVGSSLATTTVLEVGIDPSLKEEMNQIEEDLEDNRQNMTKAKKALDLLEKLKKQQGELPQDKEQMYYRLKKTKKNLQEEKARKEKKLEELENRLEKSKRGRVEVREKVFSGVTIIVGKSQYNVKDTMSTTAFEEEEGEVKQKPL